jgi:glutamate-ammonia-ligase adenylyltransferase
VCGIAPFLAPMLQRHPEWAASLVADDLSVARDAASLERAFAEADPADDAVTHEERFARLRRFKYREFVRIVTRDSTPEWVPLEASETTLREISALADLLLQRAYEASCEAFFETAGPPRWKRRDGTEIELGFCALGLGKLGGEELNFSSDVDLIYVFATPPDDLALPPDGARGEPRRLARWVPADYFTRLAQAFGKHVTAQTVDGFLFRVDLDLRPEGAQGTLVITESALETYYEAWADTWEKAAFMKARPVAGDAAVGWRAIRALAPMIYRSSMDYRAIESIRTLKSKVADFRGGQAAGFDVKIDPGGIRDVEFVAQALQLLHGARIPQIRDRSTLRALRHLSEVDLIEPDRADDLEAAYLFLRRVEHRLQMEDERQTHLLPSDDRERTHVARAVGFEGASALADFDATLDEHRAVIVQPLDRSLSQDVDEHVLDLFVQHTGRMLTNATAREMIERLSRRFAAAVDEAADRGLALNNLARFIEAVGPRRSYYELLLDRPELVPRLMRMFAVSKYLSNFVTAHPALIESLFDNPDVLLLDRAQLEADLAAVEAQLTGGDEGDEEGILNALRLFHHRQVVNVGLLDMAEKIDRIAAEAALTELAEVCIRRALRFAWDRASRRKQGVPEAALQGAYLVVAAGKLGSAELSYGSDLDVFFLYDVGEASGSAALEAQSWFVTLTQRLISALQTTTTEGACYEVDTRLRPSGNQGMLVSSMPALRRYHDADAALWERQALLRCRAVAGGDRLAEAFDALRRDVLARPLPDSPMQEIHEIRMRMEAELARETRSKRNFKTGRGGLLDVETVAQALALVHGHAHPELFDVARVETQLERLRGLGLLSDEDHATLGAGWSFLQQLASRLRIVENRSISDLDSERGDLEGLAHRLGYASKSREGGARRALLSDYRRHTEAIRAVYDRVFGTRSEARENADSGT